MTMKLSALLFLTSALITTAQEAADPNSYFKAGVQAFFDAKPKESVAAFDQGGEAGSRKQAATLAARAGSVLPPVNTRKDASSLKLTRM